MNKTVIKRTGKKVKFDPAKIINAVRKAANDCSECKVSDTDIENILLDVIREIDFYKKDTFSINEIQKAVENALMRSDFTDVARSYIEYRYIHDIVREKHDYLINTISDLTLKPSSELDDKRDNANINTDTAMGTMLKYGVTISNYFTDNYILPKDIAEAHINGDIHIHDKDFYMLTETCCQIDLKKLFDKGFNTGHGTVRTPNSIQSYASLACVVIQANQNEMHGGQAIPAFDYYMAPGVLKTFKKEFKKAIFNMLDTTTVADSNEEIATLKSRFESFIDSFDSIELDKEAIPMPCYNIALKETEKATYQAMQILIHNLNTLHSRAGSQVPFSSINYGTDTSPEGRMVMKQLLLATQDGLGKGETPIFPIQIFKVKEGVNYNEGDPNYDLFKLAIETSAKRLFPNFSFIDAPFNLKYYDPNDYETEVAYMGCRTLTMGNVNGKQVPTSRGNLSFTTINLPKLGILAKHNIDEFYKMLDEKMDLVKKQLLHRFKIQCKRHVYNYPFLMGQGVWMDSDKLKPEDTLEEVLKHGTLSIGFIGLAECLTALIGKHHGESEEAQKLGLEIVKHMRSITDKYTKETHLNFSLFATPSEGLCGRVARINQKEFGIIPGVTDRAYTTNSFHCPVWYKINAAKKIDLEAPYHFLTNAG